MASADEFKIKIENFLQNLTNKITEENSKKQIEEEYNELMDLCKNQKIFMNIDSKFLILKNIF
jgi:hypothetical protein